MAAFKVNELLIIIRDIGANTQTIVGNDKATFFDKSKECVNKILEQKIHTKYNDEVAIVSMGTDEPPDHISASELSRANWEMMRTVDKSTQYTNFTASWMAALKFAKKFIDDQLETKIFDSAKIVLITTFDTEENDQDCAQLITELNAMRVRLVVISGAIGFEKTDDLEIENAVFSQSGTKSQAQSKSEALIRKIVTETNGTLVNFDYAIDQLAIFEPTTKAMPWKCALHLGSILKIQLAAYISVTPSKCISKWETCTVDGSTVCSKRQFFIDDKKVELDLVNFIKGYMYGRTPVAGEYLAMKTEKGLECNGFVDRSRILEEYLIGIGTSCVVPQREYQTSVQIFSALVQAMIKANVVMIARRVYRNGVNAKMFVLFPKIHETDNVPYCTMAELIYAEHKNNFFFAPFTLKKYEPTPEQNDAVCAYIKAMDLMDTKNDEFGQSQAFNHTKTLNPYVQHMYRTLTYRALNPKKPIPKIEDQLSKKFEMPAKLKEIVKPIAEKIRQEFPLVMPELKSKDHWVNKLYEKNSQIAAVIEDNGEEPEDYGNLTTVGTVTPAYDFVVLVKRGERFAVVAKQIGTIIFDLLYRSMTPQLQKIVEAMMTFREQAKLMAAYQYNEWINSFKEIILERNSKSFWSDIVVKENLGLITSDETDSITVTNEEAKLFYDLPQTDVTGNDIDDYVDHDEMFAAM